MELSIMLLKNIGIWIADSPAEAFRMKLVLGFTVFLTVLSVMVEAADVYFTWYYKGDIIYVLTNVMTVALALVKVYIIMMKRTEFTNLIMHVREKFSSDKYGSHEREILENCWRICNFFVYGVTTIGFCVMVSYTVGPWVDRPENQTERVLPFTIWLTVIDLAQTPYYEIAYAIQVFALYCVGSCYFCFDNCFCIMAINLSGQFRILQHRFSRLCDLPEDISEKDYELALLNHTGKCYQKFTNYIRQHQSLILYCDRIENVYTMIILGQVLISSILICLYGYQILLAQVSVARRAIFVFLLLDSMVLLFMFTFSCHGVLEESEKVALGAYSAQWIIMPLNRFGKMLRKDLAFVIQRSGRVCCLTANGFFPVSLQTYTTVNIVPFFAILSTAMSYFTLLRGSLEEST